MSANAAGRRLRSSQVGQSNTSNKALWRAIMYGQLDWQWAWHNISGGGSFACRGRVSLHALLLFRIFEVRAPAGCCTCALLSTLYSMLIGRLVGLQGW
jgi:hypothetical protein